MLEDKKNNNCVLYEYEGRDRFGRLLRGNLCVHSKLEARRLLNAQGMKNPAVWNRDRIAWSIFFRGGLGYYWAPLKLKYKDSNKVIYGYDMKAYPDIIPLILLGIVCSSVTFFCPLYTNYNIWSIISVLILDAFFAFVALIIILRRFELQIDRKNRQILTKKRLFPLKAYEEREEVISAEKILFYTEVFYTLGHTVGYVVSIQTQDKVIQLNFPSGNRKKELQFAQSVAEYLNIPLESK